MERRPSSSLSSVRYSPLVIVKLEITISLRSLDLGSGKSSVMVGVIS